MKRIAFVTSSDNPAITEDDMILSKHLAEHFVISEGAAWDDETVEWKAYDLILLRSCWNYHLIPERFGAWIKRISAFSKVLNSPELILWNMNKSYLKELGNGTVAIPETEWLIKEDLTNGNLHRMLKERGWKAAVLKPCISASSFHTHLIEEPKRKHEAENSSFEFIEGGMMLQKFMHEVVNTGELSLMFFAGEFSHAVLKTAKPGEFRVQHQFGGNSESVEISRDIITVGERILDALATVPLYARIDGIMAGKSFTLMELELIEPVLFFRHAPELSLRRIAATLSSMV